MNAAQQKTSDVQNFGIKTGLSLLLNHRADDPVRIRAYSFDGEGNPTLHDIELSVAEAARLHRNLTTVLDELGVSRERR